MKPATGAASDISLASIVFSETPDDTPDYRAQKNRISGMQFCPPVGGFKLHNMRIRSDILKSSFQYVISQSVMYIGLMVKVSRHYLGKAYFDKKLMTKLSKNVVRP